MELGASQGDLLWDYRRAFIRFPKHESDEPGHIFSAILEDADFMLAKAFTSSKMETAKFVFNDLLRLVLTLRRCRVQLLHRVLP